MGVGALLAEYQPIIAVVVVIAVILVVAFDVLDLAIAAMLGTIILLLTGVLTTRGIVRALESGGPALTLLFGGMVVARTLRPTGVFEWLGIALFRFARGRGRRLLLGIVVLVAPICAILPNATVVILLAPAIISATRMMKADIVPPIILMVVVSNCSGLLTLVGDPATFIVGSSIHLTFGDYLARLTLGGLLTILAVLPLIPRLLPEHWRLVQVPSAPVELPGIKQRGFTVIAFGILALMVALFIAGDRPGFGMPPAVVSILGATFALLAIYQFRIEQVSSVFADIDWRTLIFIGCMFTLVQGLIDTGVISGRYRLMGDLFGTNYALAAVVMLFVVGIVSGLVPNIPMVVAAVAVTKGYFVYVELVPEEAIAGSWAGWPGITLPVFAGLMFGATLGGSATLIGAASNVVAAGICQQQGSPIGFARYLRIGLPFTLVQVMVAAVYVLVLYLVVAARP